MSGQHSKKCACLVNKNNDYPLHNSVNRHESIHPNNQSETKIAAREISSKHDKKCVSVLNKDNSVPLQDLVNKNETIYPNSKSDNKIEKVECDVIQKRVPSVRFADDTYDNSSDKEDNTQELDKVEANRQNDNVYSTSLKRDSVTNFCWWDDWFPMHSCQICTYDDPEFWNCYLRIVLAILLCMLLATAAFIFYVTFANDLANTLHKNFYLVIALAIISILSLNYFMLSYITDNFYCMSYFILLVVVAVYSLFLGALTAKFETEAFLYGILTTAFIVFTLLGITWCPCFCFSQWGIVLPVALSVALLSGFFMHFFFSSFYAKSYPTRHLILIGSIIALHAIVISFEIGRLLNSSFLDPYCLDYGLGAYLLYTMFLQIFFYWLYLLFECLTFHYTAW